MKKMLVLPYGIEKSMSVEEKLAYYKRLRNDCKDLISPNKNMSLGQKAISKFYMPQFYDKKLEIENSESVFTNTPSIIVCNHSNAHDIFSMYIAMQKLGINTSVMVATDCLNPLSISIFSLSNATFLDRNDRVSSANSIIESSAKVLSGQTLIIFGESTWNLHPTKLMHDLKRGSAMISAITEAPVIPAILEYVEVDQPVKKESDIYKKIILRFGEPQITTAKDDMHSKTAQIQTEMKQIRENIWKQNGINRASLSEVDPEIYINHTYLKKFGCFGFSYDSQKEQKFIRSSDNLPVENEYALSENNELIPGITYKKQYKNKFNNR